MKWRYRHPLCIHYLSIIHLSKFSFCIKKQWLGFHWSMYVHQQWFIVWGDFECQVKGIWDCIYAWVASSHALVKRHCSVKDSKAIDATRYGTTCYDTSTHNTERHNIKSPYNIASYNSTRRITAQYRTAQPWGKVHCSVIQNCRTTERQQSDKWQHSMDNRACRSAMQCSIVFQSAEKHSFVLWIIGEYGWIQTGSIQPKAVQY